MPHSRKALPSIIVAGAAGRMGRQVVRAARAADLEVIGGIDRAGAPEIGADLGVLAGLDPIGCKLTAADAASFQKDAVIIDFSMPDGAVATAEKAASAGARMVIGVTGFSAKQEESLAVIAKNTPILKSGNMSLGVNLLAAFAEIAARQLGDEYDVEIFEAHHREKVDAPSGTALMLADAIARGRGVNREEKLAQHDLFVRKKRNKGDIGLSVLRGGGIVGDHDVAFAGDAEILKLSHRATDRALFAEGAVAAARWIADKPPGLYDMTDVLGLKSLLQKAKI